MKDKQGAKRTRRTKPLVLPVGQSPTGRTSRLIVNTDGHLIYPNGCSTGYHIDASRVMRDQPHRVYNFTSAMKNDFTVLTQKIEGRSYETHGVWAYRTEVLIHDGAVVMTGSTPPEGSVTDTWCCCRRWVGQSHWMTFNCVEHFGKDVLRLPFPGLVAHNENVARERLADKLAALKAA